MLVTHFNPLPISAYMTSVHKRRTRPCCNTNSQFIFCKKAFLIDSHRLAKMTFEFEPDLWCNISGIQAVKLNLLCTDEQECKPMCYVIFLSRHQVS